MGLGWVRGIVDCSRTGGNAVGGASISPSPARQPAMPPPSHASHTFRSQDRFCISTEGRWLRSFLALQQQLSQLYQNPSPKAYPVTHKLRTFLTPPYTLAVKLFRTKLHVRCYKKMTPTLRSRELCAGYAGLSLGEDAYNGGGGEDAKLKLEQVP